MKLTDSDKYEADRRAYESARRWLPTISVEGAFANVFIVITGGAFLTGIALFLGANDFEIGLLGAIPFMAQLAQLFSAYLAKRAGGRKSYSVRSAIFGRQIWWLVIPVLFMPGEWRLELFFTILVLSNLAIMTAAPVWLSWMADIVPDRIRARYFGFRSAGIAFSTVSATVLGGIILDKFLRSGEDATGFAVILGFACLFALAAVLLLRRLPDRPSDEQEADFGRWSDVLEPFKDPNFRRLLKVFFVWNIAVGIASVFFAAHMITNLKMSFTMISLYSAVPAIMAVILNKPWGVVIDRFGSRPVIVLCALGIGLIPLIWWIPRPDFLWILGFEAIYSGALWTGFNLAAFNIPISNSPRNKRMSYLAMFAVITGIGYFAASIAGGFLAESFSFVHWQIGRQTIVNYHLLFGVSAVLRLLAGLLFLSFHEPKEKAIPIMVQFMGYSMLKRLSLGRQILPRGVRMIGDFVHQQRRDFHWR
ncbi:MAG TPA: MFS transporter [candidate division Zixibacteria bacterium]|nr:MFS transporter [candidate division Zixibacteria bacterium]